MELSYKEIVAIQEKIESFRTRLRELISVVDENGHRKLNPFFFLSGEIAAYKILNTWHNQILKNALTVNKELLETLDRIETLFEVREYDFEEAGSEESYEEFSQLLWYDLFEHQYDDAIAEINADIIGLSRIVQVLNGATLEELNSDSNMAYDDINMGIVYVETHNMIMNLEPLEREVVFEVIKKTRLYKMHFDMFQ